MIEALVRVFPNHPPYEGAFEEILPHLTVAQGESLDEVEAALAATVPLRSRAESVVLYRKVADDRWDAVAEFDL